MADHERFRFRDLTDLQEKISELGLDLPVSENVGVFARSARFGPLTVPNRLAVHPMEGCDANPDGSPGPLTYRRYRRFGAGGAGLIWVEATAVMSHARANPHQLWIRSENVESFRELVRQTRAAAREANGYEPVLVLQLTHSGRYSRPVDAPCPIIAHHSPVLDPKHNLPPDYPLITDEELDDLRERYVKAARLARQAGFDAVDIKSCHRYLMSELLASFTRENSRYGGSFENRTRLLMETVERLREEIPGYPVTCRLNVYDALDYPYGWGVSRESLWKPDLTEPLRLIGMLRERGFGGLNVTLGNPYYTPSFGRPYDFPTSGGSPGLEHPLEGVARLLHLAREVQQTYPDLAVVGTGYSWLRRFLPYFAAAAIEKGWTTLVGLGRGGFAYPDFARDLLQKGILDPQKVCVSCSSCTQMMRDGVKSGCVVRDAEVYAPIFREGRLGDSELIRKLASECRDCTDPSCAVHCPAGIDIPAFLHAAAEGREKDAYRILRRANLLPETCARVCPVEVQCQGHCIQRHLGERAVPVAAVQNYIARKARKMGWTALEVPERWSGYTVAVVGGGPAGLAASASLIERGHRVRIYERSKGPGGKARSVIPPWRVTEADALLEIESIFSGISGDRIEWYFGKELGSGLSLDTIFSEGANAVVLAMGLGSSTKIVPREERPEGVLEALHFLIAMHEAPERTLSGTVAVIGGGNTALDSAVTAARRGAKTVYLLYRRGYAEMPAWPKERKEALDAGVHFLILSQPVGYERDPENRLTGVRIARTRLGTPDASGRARPEVIPGSEYVLPADLVIEALGERIPATLFPYLGNLEITSTGLLFIDSETGMTTRPGVFAAGDIVSGGSTVVQSVAEGMKAGEAVDRFLRQG